MADKSVKLSSIAEIFSGRILPNKSTPNGTLVSYVRISDMENYSINPKISKKIRVDRKILARIPQKFRLKTGDVLLSTQATIGKTALAKSKSSGDYFSSAIMALRANSEV